MKLSIITINYNNLEGLQRTLDSVFGQSTDDFEYVVIDGGSTDGSSELIEKNSARISYWVSEKDNGIYNAMNKGIAAAKGEYLLFLNSGDELFDSAVIDQVISKLHTHDIIACDLQYIYETHTVYEANPNEVSFNTFYRGTIYHPSTFIKKIAFQQVGLYDEKLKIVSDWKWFMFAICKHQKTYFHCSLLVSKFYFDGISSAPENLIKVRKEREKVLREEFSAFLKDYILLNEQNLIISNYEKKTKAGFLKKLKGF